MPGHGRAGVPRSCLANGLPAPRTLPITLPQGTQLPPGPQLPCHLPSASLTALTALAEWGPEGLVLSGWLIHSARCLQACACHSTGHGFLPPWAGCYSVAWTGRTLSIPSPAHSTASGPHLQVTLMCSLRGGGGGRPCTGEACWLGVSCQVPITWPPQPWRRREGRRPALPTDTAKDVHPWLAQRTNVQATTVISKLIQLKIGKLCFPAARNRCSALRASGAQGQCQVLHTHCLTTTAMAGDAMACVPI